MRACGNTDRFSNTTCTNYVYNSKTKHLDTINPDTQPPAYKVALDKILMNTGYRGGGITIMKADYIKISNTDYRFVTGVWSVKDRTNGKPGAKAAMLISNPMPASGFTKENQATFTP